MRIDDGRIDEVTAMKPTLTPGVSLAFRCRRWTVGFGLGLALAFAASGASQPRLAGADLKNSEPLSPRDEQKTFRVAQGFRVELVASEPNVVDPVAMAFDEKGRIFVAEMRGYPNAGVATGTITSGRIKLLEDRDGDGFYETSTIYADNLRLPTGVMPYKGGLLVANAPDLLYLEDSKGQGNADRRKVLYTGFNLANIQQLVNSLQWGLDNWVHGCAGSDGGTIHSVEKPDAPPITLRSRGIRFHPDVPGSLEPTSGGGQYGLTADDYGRWFTATNSQHLRQIVLPDNYLRRNPLLPVSAVTLDIPEHGPACKVYRISPFEAWRVERTTRRKEGPDARRFPTTELVPGGYVTSACSPLIYTAEAFPPAYRGNNFVCDPANNLIHCEKLVPKGVVFSAVRIDPDHEFLASTDNWFRPVHLTLGPDGAIYVLDFYREVIESPLSLPDDIKKRLNVESRGRGRIWRIVPESAEKNRQPIRPALDRASPKELVENLAHPNSWWRLTAQRLLVERKAADKEVVNLLENLVEKGPSGPALAHALWTLDGLDRLDQAHVIRGLKDSEPGVREQALRLAERWLATEGPVRRAVAELAEDRAPRVRFQAAFSLGEKTSGAEARALARIAQNSFDDPWIQTAVLCSAHHCAGEVLEAMLADKDLQKNTPAPALAFCRRLASLLGAGGKEADVGRLLLLAGREKEVAAWQAALIEGLGEGMRLGGRDLTRLWEQPPEGLREAVKKARGLFEQAAATGRDSKARVADRENAARLLASGPFALLQATAPEMLTPQTPSEVQRAAIRALAPQPQPAVADLLLQGWAGYSPVVRREALEALLARTDRLNQLLDAVEQKKVLPVQLEPQRIEQLRRHPDAKIRRRALALFSGQLTLDRQKVVQSYRSALELTADAVRGKGIFAKTCATCHRLENVGLEVGPDLLSALRNKSGEQLVIDILDPSREVDPRYLNYQITDKRGRTYTGLIAAETGSSITLRRGDKQEDTLLRTQIEEITATAKSLMPEGLEMQLNKQDLADLVAYLQAVSRPKP
jgi:putative membrane-bound dehydrogenase-like protein